MTGLTTDTAAWTDLATDHTISELKQRSGMLLSINLFGVAITFIMGIVVLRQGYMLLAVNNIAVGVLLGMSLVLQLVFRKPVLAGHISMGAAVILFLMFLVQAGPDNSAVLWFNTYPLIVMFVTGRRNGLIYSGAVLLAAAVMLLTPVQGLLLNEFSGQMKARIFLTFGLTAYMAYVYERLRDTMNRTAYRTTGELKKMLARLERTNRELQQFTALASHDLQEPARKLAIFSRRLMREATSDLPEPVIDSIVRIDSNVTRINAQLAGLREYARITAAGVKPAAVDLATVLATVKGELAELTYREHASVFGDSLPIITADPRAMRSLLRHLVQNAIVHHRQDRHPMVTVTAAIADDDGTQQCELRVRDNGTGIDERYRDRIFDVFETDGSGAPGRGPGIGLTVCRRIAEMHGGSITVDSTPGKGSTFTVIIPIPDNG